MKLKSNHFDEILREGLEAKISCGILAIIDIVSKDYYE